MITHVADLTLPTPSKEAVKQWYRDILRFPVEKETGDEVRFRAASHFTLTFQERYAPVVPAHFAFEVPDSRFDASVSFLRRAGIPLLRWPDGREVDRHNSGRSVYFRDGDGHLLEIISHSYIKENVLLPHGALNIMYLREIGLPAEDAPAFRERLKQLLHMKTSVESDVFNFVIGGTVHAVVVSSRRRWIPVGMAALPPDMDVTLGVSEPAFMDRVRTDLTAEELLPDMAAGELRMRLSGFRFRLTHTPDFAPELPGRLGLPLSNE